MNHGQVLIKVYGHVWPVDESLMAELAPLLPLSDHVLPEDMLEQDKDMLRLTFEGLYFPLEAVLEVWQRHLDKHSQGKLDYLDLEQWTLTRFVVQGNSLTQSTVSLNHVLDHAGH